MKNYDDKREQWKLRGLILLFLYPEAREFVRRGLVRARRKEGCRLLRLHLVIYRLSSALCRPTKVAGRIDGNGLHEREVTYVGVNHATEGCDARRSSGASFSFESTEARVRVVHIYAHVSGTCISLFARWIQSLAALSFQRKLIRQVL